MKLPRYELKVEKALMVFEFISEGKKGSIPKLIKFSETTLHDFYNLAFGDKDSTTLEINDIVVVNNGDCRTALSPVVIPAISSTTTGRYLGYKEFELSNHLGNVIATVSDRKIQLKQCYIDGSDPVFVIENCGPGINSDFAGYFPDLLMHTDYYAFGSPMPGRQFNAGNYRYGFNGKENDNEVKGTGNQQDYGMRIYDPRLGKFLSVDPIGMSFPYYSPFHFGGNSPISHIDLDGAEDLSYMYKQNKDNSGYTLVGITDYRNIGNGSTGSSGHGIQVIFINRKGDIRHAFYATNKFDSYKEPFSNKISKLLEKPMGNLTQFVPKGNMKNVWVGQGKENSPILKSELGTKISQRTGPIKSQYKAYINDVGQEFGVGVKDLEQKLTVSSSISYLKIDDNFGISPVPLYWSFVFNNKAGRNMDKEEKLNVQVPLNNIIGIQFTVNDYGFAAIEFNLITSKKFDIELEGNGDVYKEKAKVESK